MNQVFNQKHSALMPRLCCLIGLVQMNEGCRAYVSLKRLFTCDSLCQLSLLHLHIKNLSDVIVGTQATCSRLMIMGSLPNSWSHSFKEGGAFQHSLWIGVTRLTAVLVFQYSKPYEFTRIQQDWCPYINCNTYFFVDQNFFFSFYLSWHSLVKLCSADFFR